MKYQLDDIFKIKYRYYCFSPGPARYPKRKCQNEGATHEFLFIVCQTWLEFQF